MTETPDHVPCRHCGVPISWDEVCWTHDDTGFADCDLHLTGGKRIDAGDVDIIVGPKLNIAGPNAGKKAEPVGEWS